MAKQLLILAKSMNRFGLQKPKSSLQSMMFSIRLQTEVYITETYTTKGNV